MSQEFKVHFLLLCQSFSTVSSLVTIHCRVGLAVHIIPHLSLSTPGQIVNIKVFKRDDGMTVYVPVCVFVWSDACVLVRMGLPQIYA